MRADYGGFVLLLLDLLLFCCGGGGFVCLVFSFVLSVVLFCFVRSGLLKQGFAVSPWLS